MGSGPYHTASGVTKGPTITKEIRANKQPESPTPTVTTTDPIRAAGENQIIQPLRPPPGIPPHPVIPHGGQSRNFSKFVSGDAIYPSTSRAHMWRIQIRASESSGG